MKTMKGKLSLLYVTCLVSLMVFVAVSSTPASSAAADAAKVRNIKFSSQMPVGNFITVLDDAFLKRVEQRTGGALKFTHYPAQQLYAAAEMANVLTKGGVEMADISWDKVFGLVPEGTFGASVGLDYDWLTRFWFDTAGGGGYYYTHIKPGFARNNMQVIGLIGYGPNNYTITKKVMAKMDDYKGLKIRASGKTQAAMLEVWGAKTVMIPSTDVYEAIQRGTIDGACSGPTTLVDRKWYEVSNQYQSAPCGGAYFGLVANMDFWKSLTDEQRKIIEEEGRKLELDTMAKSIEIDGVAMKQLEAKGIKFLKFSPEETKKMQDLSFPAMKKVCTPLLGEAGWNQAEAMIMKTRNGTATWRQILDGRKF